ncbi:MAG: head GIN domain-containing protein [Pirellulaceae bacterium]
MRCLIALPVLLLLVVPGCFIGTPGSGVSKTEIREVADFDRVSFGGSGDVTIRAGQEKSVTVTFDDNLIEMVETKVVDGELLIRVNGSYNSSLGLDVEIGVPQLVGASASGVGDIEVHDVKGSKLDVTVSGVGEIKATGNVDNLEVHVSGVGSAELQDLKAKHVEVSVSGTGGAEVFASESVEASASGVGGIDVYGNPSQIQETASGVGDIDFKN